MWVIASIPFWIAGGGLLISMLLGMKKVLDRPKQNDDLQAITGMFMLVIVAGGLLVLAAKIAS